MKIGIFADIHGNATALEAVMEDCRKRGIYSFILLGDLFAKGPGPEKVYRLLGKCNIAENIIGNTEKWFMEKKLSERQKELVKYGIDAFPEIKDFINRMKEQVIWKLPGKNILLVHYWPRNLSKAERIDYLHKNSIDIVISAHTHIPVEIRKNKNCVTDKIWFINPGSIGAPYDSDRRGSYGILTVGKDIHFEVIRITYDYEKEIREAYQRKIPFVYEYSRTVYNAEKMKYTNPVNILR